MAMPQKKQPEPQAPQPRRSMLSAVTRGKVQSPDRILLYGTEGVGKSSWAAAAPGAIFLPAEDGTDRVDCARMPTPEKWADVFDAVEELRTAPHDYRTLVIDTLDAIEPLCWRHVTARDEMESIEAYGFGKGYAAALDEWRRLLAECERLRRARQMQIVLLAHAQIRPFKNPEGDDYDRYELKLHAKAGGLVKEWCDSVLFARFEELAHKDGKTKRVRGVSTGARIVHTLRTAAYDAKSRHALPETMPLDYATYAAAVAGQSSGASEIRARIAAKLPQLSDAAKRAAVERHVAEIGDDAAKLAAAENLLNARLAEQAPAEEGTNV